MKRLTAIILCLIIALGTTATFAESSTSNIVVLCFSATDNTWGIAEKIAALTGADLMRIEPEIPYTAEDLNWHDNNSRASREQNDDSCRPAIANLPDNLDGYDTVFIGFPIWWGTIPQIIKTLVETVDFEGKTIVLFCTSGSSGISTAIRDLKALDSGAVVLENGRRFPAGAPEADVRDWLNEIGVPAGRDETKPDQTAEEDPSMKSRMKITVGNRTMTAVLENNESAEALKELLKDGPYTVSGSNYGGFEKVCSLGTRLPRNDTYITTKPGDVVLYTGSSICFYYAQNSWDFTMLAHVEALSDAEIREILSGPETEVTMELID